MTDSLLLRRGLYVAIASCLVAGLLSAAVIGGGDRDSGVATDERIEATATTASSQEPDDATTVPPAEVAVSGDGGAGATAPASAGAAPETTVATPGGSQPAPAPPSTAPPTTAAAAQAPASGDFAELGSVDDGGAVSMPKPGLYTYDVKGGDQPATGTTRYEDKGAGAAGRNFVVTMKGMGLDSTSDVVWGAKDVRVTKTQIQFGGQTFTCDWEPDHVELQTSIEKGKQWTSTSSCTIGTAVVKRTASATVVDARRVRVRGEEIVTWVLEGTERIEFNNQVQEARGTTWFSAAHGLIVRSVMQSAEGDRETLVKSLQPEP